MKKQLVKPITQLYQSYGESEEGILRGMSVNSNAESALHSSIYAYPRWGALLWSTSYQNQSDNQLVFDCDFEEWFEDMRHGINYTDSEFGFRIVRNK